jgi:hypothetical protein
LTTKPSQPASMYSASCSAIQSGGSAIAWRPRSSVPGAGSSWS